MGDRTSIVYQYRIWAHDTGDDSIDMVISHLNMGYLVTLVRRGAGGVRRAAAF